MKKSGITLEIRGLINDLTRTLAASLIHLDDLLLDLDKKSAFFDHAVLLDQQLGRALEFFLEMRSDFLIWQDIHHVSNTKKKSGGKKKSKRPFNARLSSSCRDSEQHQKTKKRGRLPGLPLL